MMHELNSFYFILVFNSMVRLSRGIECYTCRPDVSKKMYCTRPEDLYMKWCPESNQCVLHRYFDEPYYEFRDCDRGDEIAGCTDLKDTYPTQSCRCEEDYCNHSSHGPAVANVLMVASFCVTMVATVDTHLLMLL